MYLFRSTATGWETSYRSGCLSPYMGAYNHLYPVKDGLGHTIKLVVVSAGYVHAFAVDWTQV